MPVQDDLQHHDNDDLDPTPDKITNAPAPLEEVKEPVTLNNVTGRTIQLTRNGDEFYVNPEDQEVADIVGLLPHFGIDRLAVMQARAEARSVALVGL